ncbi:hypothetical protein FP2506_08151 [Fulvimarina pelagi HTCC2506]|uniref:DUF3253 domain-containing protein n=1 Tax=Fulvimarina pelagi HTCC2506 TaxID=314231 RepID=Q0G6B6_9HYPH|nr:DUF3253 domain-containing protein [Fulvimarina pelagi]EAU42798.1 hypothetical protein FP2506_08151 [Fulvimarina pelagi HTCC2506]
MSDATQADITQTILELCAERGTKKTACPTEVARLLAGSNEADWRKLMPAIRQEAIRLAKADRIVIKRKGKPVDPDDFKGIYRLAIARMEAKDGG